MNEIRAFSVEDLAEVGALHLRVLRGQKRAAPDSLLRYFREIFLENPWVDPELPSLVCRTGGGQLAGFLGVIPRPMIFEGRPIRSVHTTQFTVDPEHRGGGLPALAILKRLFSGPQELSMTDGAVEAANLVWSAAGGAPALLYSFSWLRPLRPVRTAAEFAFRESARGRKILTRGRHFFQASDWVVSRLAARLRPSAPAGVRSRLVSARELQKVIADGGIREPLRPDYQPEHFEWLLKQADGGKEGLRAAVVENASTGSSCGWWVYLQENDAAATLFHIGARRRDQFGAVFDSLLYDAWEQGMALLRGPAIPAALPTLSQKGCLFRQMSTRTLFHTRDPKIELALLRGEAALSWLDSESWLHFARRSWT